MKRLTAILLSVLLLSTVVCGCDCSIHNEEIDVNDEVVTSSVTDTKKGGSVNNTEGSISEVSVTTEIEYKNNGFLNGNDRFGDLDLETVKKIKKDYVKKIENANLSNVVIEDYYGTYSDGSVFLDIYYAPNGMLHGGITADDYVTVGNYYCRYIHSEPIMVYKNNSFYNIETAYEKGIIGDSVLDDFFIRNPKFNEGLRLFTDDDKLGNLSFEQAKEIKWYYDCLVLSKKENNFYVKYKSVGYTEIQLIYCGRLSDDNIMVKFKVTKPIEKETTVTEEVLGYKYEHLYSDVAMIYNKKAGKPFLYNIGTAYEKGYVTKADVDKFFEMLNNFK